MRRLFGSKRDRANGQAFKTCMFLSIVTSAFLLGGSIAQGTEAPIHITGLASADGNQKALAIGLDGQLAVMLSTEKPVDASQFALFLNGRFVPELDDTFYDTRLHALIFHLQRNSANSSVWNGLLGSPMSLTSQMSVTLGARHPDNSTPQPTITGATAAPTFTFVILSPWRLLIATIAVLSTLVLVWGAARKSAVLKDNLIPQIDPKRQTYSLGRWQMAVWFSLVFACYVFLYILLGDPNTLSNQALMLMGISGATALSSIVVDAAKDTPTDGVNAGLRLMGIKSYTDVERIRKEITDRTLELGANDPPLPADRAAQLSAEILDRQAILRTYEEDITPFVSEGWFRDMVTDVNGTALHRLQVLCWTGLLGAIFVFEVWHNLAMPQFSPTLLALMAISGAGYVGFKYPEVQD